MIDYVFLLKVSCPTDYCLWQQTIYSHLGEKWVKLHCGPMWCTSSLTQDSDDDAFHTTQQHLSQRTMKVYQMNVCFMLYWWYLSGLD